MNDELDRIWKEVFVALPGFYPSICLKGLRKNTKTPSQGSRYPNWDSNGAPIGYKYRALSLDWPV
jgi:hypothetical protein